MKFSLLSHLCFVSNCVGLNEGFSFTPCYILIVIGGVLIKICNGNHDWHVLVCIWVFSTQNCEAVILAKFGLACVYARLLKCLDMLGLHREHAPCMHMCIMHARCDVTRFTYNASHVIVTSLEFTFHSCCRGMRWHDIIGVHIA